MRYGYTEGLAKILEHHNPKAHLICEAIETTAEDIKDKKADWDGADSLTGMESLDDGGVRITGSALTHVQNTTSTTFLQDLSSAAPWSVGMVRWSDIGNQEWRELSSVTAHLVNRRDGGQDGEVTRWQCRMFRVHEFRDSPEGGTQIILEPLGSPIQVAAGSYSTSAVTVTFNFSYNGNPPRIGPEELSADDQPEGTFGVGK